MVTESETFSVELMMIFEFLYPLGFNSSKVNEVIASLDGISGKQFSSSTHRIVKDRDFLVIDTSIKYQASARQGVPQRTTRLFVSE